jgi:hypothetical protein
VNIFRTVVETEYGTVEVTGDSAHIIDRAPKRRDGQPDRRYTYGKLAQFVIGAIIDRKRAEFLAA